MTIAVWGATGFIGRQVVECLRAQGHRVRALCRDMGNLPASWSGKVDARSLPLDADAASFRDALAGVDCVIHCAGTPSQADTDLRDYETGTLALVSAAAEACIERMIVLSTVAVYGGGRRHGRIGIDTVPAPDSPYGESRLRTEQAARGRLSGPATRLCIVRVPAVVGPDMTATVLQRFFRGLRGGWFLHPGNRDASFACIGVQRLAERLAGLATGPLPALPELCQFADNIRWTDLVAKYEAAAGRHVARLPVPAAPVRGLVRLLGTRSLDGPLQALGNRARFADDGDPAGMAPATTPTAADVDAVLAQIVGRNPGAVSEPPRDDCPRRLFFLLWVAFFAYTTSAALLFQKLMLPALPGLHGGSGLLNTDSLYFHKIAIDVARGIAEVGWDSWSPWPTKSASGNAAVLGALYYWFGPEPALVVPLNAVLHATAALLLVYLARAWVPGRAGLIGGISAATLFILFPSGLNWYAQPHKDGYAILGFLLYLLGLVTMLRGAILRSLVLAAAGLALTAFVRPNNLVLLAVAALPLPLLCAGAGGRRRVIAAVSMIALTVAAVYLSGTRVAAGETLNLRQYEKIAAPGLETPAVARQWKWQPLEGPLRPLDRQLEKATNVRVNFIVFGSAVGAASMLDPERIPGSAGEVLAYFPRALQLALFAPFPNQWLTQLSPTRLVGNLETAIWYLMLPGLLFGLLRFSGRQSILLLWVALTLLTVESYLIPNLGTLHRIRFPFLFVLITMGAAGWMAWIMGGGRNRALPPRVAPPVDADVLGSPAKDRRRLVLLSLGVAAFTTLGFLGFFLRDLLMARRFGLGTELDVFQLAMLLPLFLVNLLAVPVNAAVVPVFLRIREESVDAGRSWIRAMAYRLLVSFSALAAAGGVGGFLVAHLSTPGSHAWLAWEMGLWFLPVVALSGITVFGNALLNALGRAMYAAAVQVVVPVSAVCGLLLFADRYGAASVAAAMAVGQVLNLLLLADALKRAGYSLAPRPALPGVRGGLSNLYPILIVASFLSSAALPVGLLLAARLPTGEVASLALGSKVIQFATGMGTSVLVAAVLPYFARLVVGDRQGEARRELAFLLKLSTFVSVPIALAVAQFAQEIASLLFAGGRMGGSEVGQVAAVLRYGILQLPFFAVTTVLVKFSIASRRVAWILAAALLGQCVNAAASILLMGRFGAPGIALGMLAGTAASAAIMLGWFCFRRDIALIAAAMLATGWLLFLSMAVSIFTGSTVGILIGAVAFALLMASEPGVLPRRAQGASA